MATTQSLPLLRILTCGSVDDGKSTLIGRLLYDSNRVFEDHAAALESDSKKMGNAGEALDFALLVDGLQSEREQGITIDVAYRYFATARRKFIIADTPGHEQYTRNMVTGASVSDVAVMLIDARKGVLQQTRRHAIVCHLIGIRHAVLAVNKMDLAGFSHSRFDEIVADFSTFLTHLGAEIAITAIPVVATDGQNVVRRGEGMGWYQGPTLIEALEAMDVTEATAWSGARLPVQWVCRPHLDFRGFAGTLHGGGLKPGDALKVLPSGVDATVQRIVAPEGDRAEARPGEAVMITLDREVDVVRGDVLASADDLPEVSDQIAAEIICLGGHGEDQANGLVPGRSYLLRAGPQEIPCTLSRLKYRIDIDTLGHSAARSLALNEIGKAELSLARPLVFAPYAESRALGSFILVERETGATVGAGVIRFALRRATNIRWQDFDVTPEARAKAKGQKPVCVWFTGLSGAGKSTIANLLDRRLAAMGRHAFVLDGDNVRHGLNRDLGFTEADRVENIRRVTEVARLMLDAGLITLVSFISPFRTERDAARERIGQGRFIEVHVDAPLDLCETRDPKGLYAKARAGKLANMTGISQPYEAPLDPELRIDTASLSPEEAVERIIARLSTAGALAI